MFRTSVVCLVCLFALSGCMKTEAPVPAGNDATSTAAPAQDAKKPLIALVMKSLGNEFFMTMEQGARDHQASNASRYELVTNGIKDEQDVGKQMELVEQMIASGVDAIVITPTDSKALAPVCKRAMDAGIVVVNIDNKFDEAVLKDIGITIPFVGPDNRKGAKAVAEYAVTKLQPGDPVAVIEGVPTAFNAQQRKLGFEDALNAAGVKIVTSQSAGWEMNEATNVVGAIITEHPEIKAFICANDSMALGAVAALRAAGKDEVLVTGYDNISAVQELMKEGRILVTADQHSDQLAVFGIEYALEMLEKGGVPADRETPVDLIK